MLIIFDYTTAEGEFITQNLDGTFKNTNIKTGMGYFAADINRNKKLDGGDLTKLFSQTVSVDQLVLLPSQYTPGSGGHMSVMTLEKSVFNGLDTESWKTALPHVLFRTGNIGTNLPLDLKYALIGDINRSHSSQVVDAQGVIKVNSFINIIDEAYDIEYKLLQSYSALQHALCDSHPATFNFIQKYVDIQNESVGAYSDLLNALMLINIDNKLDLLIFEERYF